MLYDMLFLLASSHMALPFFRGETNLAIIERASACQK